MIGRGGRPFKKQSVVRPVKSLWVWLRKFAKKKKEISLSMNPSSYRTLTHTMIHYKAHSKIPDKSFRASLSFGLQKENLKPVHRNAMYLLEQLEKLLFLYFFLVGEPFIRHNYASRSGPIIYQLKCLSESRQGFEFSCATRCFILLSFVVISHKICQDTIRSGKGKPLQRF